MGLSAELKKQGNLPNGRKEAGSPTVSQAAKSPVRRPDRRPGGSDEVKRTQGKFREPANPAQSSGATQVKQSIARQVAVKEAERASRTLGERLPLDFATNPQGAGQDRAAPMQTTPQPPAAPPVEEAFEPVRGGDEALPDADSGRGAGGSSGGGGGGYPAYDDSVYDPTQYGGQGEPAADPGSEGQDTGAPAASGGGGLLMLMLAVGAGIYLLTRQSRTMAGNVSGMETQEVPLPDAPAGEDPYANIIVDEPKRARRKQR